MKLDTFLDTFLCTVFIIMTSITSFFQTRSSVDSNLTTIIQDLNIFCDDKNPFSRLSQSKKQHIYESIDGLAEILRGKLQTKYKGNWSTFCKDFNYVCRGNKKCTNLDPSLDPKAFIAHIIHALQDWGLFKDYMGISFLDNKRLFRKASRRVDDPIAYATYVATKSVDLTRFLYRKFNNDNTLISEEISKIHLRKDNVIFLRKFDTDCCNIKGSNAPSSGKRKEQNDNHDEFITDITIVINALTSSFSVSTFETPGKKNDKRKSEKKNNKRKPKENTRGSSSNPSNKRRKTGN